MLWTWCPFVWIVVPVDIHYIHDVMHRQWQQPYVVLPWTKKRTIIEIRGEKNAVPRVISCSIRRDQRRANPVRDCPRLLPCADRAWSSMISHVKQRSSRRESRGWFFFLSREVEPSPAARGCELTQELNWNRATFFSTYCLNEVFRWQRISWPTIERTIAVNKTLKMHCPSLFSLSWIFFIFFFLYYSTPLFFFSEDRTLFLCDFLQ